jgi:hypothetical protein
VYYGLIGADSAHVQWEMWESRARYYLGP